MDFASTFSAAIAGVDTETYIERMKGILEKLDDLAALAQRIQVTSWEDYVNAMNVKGNLSSAFCYAFNNDLPESDRTLEIEMEIGKKVFEWTYAQQAPSDERLLIQYLLSSWYFQIDKEWRINVLKGMLKSGRLWRKGHDYYLTGIHKKLGDNTFRNGNRQYLNSCVPQAFEVSPRDKDLISEFIIDTIPALPPYFEETALADGKYCAKPISLSKRQKAAITTMIQLY